MPLQQLIKATPLENGKFKATEYQPFWVKDVQRSRLVWLLRAVLRVASACPKNESIGASGLPPGPALGGESSLHVRD